VELGATGGGTRSDAVAGLELEKSAAANSGIWAACPFAFLVMFEIRRDDRICRQGKSQKIVDETGIP
jgi:hypothetical protein